MTVPPQDRRSRSRLPVQTPVKVRQADGSEHEGLTRDLSSSGVFFYSDTGLAPGTKLELVITLPPEIGIRTGGWALCQASVIRVDEEPGKGVGVAAVMDRIELLPEIS